MPNDVEATAAIFKLEVREISPLPACMKHMIYVYMDYFHIESRYDGSEQVASQGKMRYRRLSYL